MFYSSLTPKTPVIHLGLFYTTLKLIPKVCCYENETCTPGVVDALEKKDVITDLLIWQCPIVRIYSHCTGCCFFLQVPGLSCYRVVSWMPLTGSTLLRCCSTISRMPVGHGLVSCVVVVLLTPANTSVIQTQVCVTHTSHTHTRAHTPLQLSWTPVAWL